MSSWFSSRTSRFELIMSGRRSRLKDNRRLRRSKICYAASGQSGRPIMSTNRRTFLKSTAAASAAAGLAYVPNFVHADGVRGTLKVGLIGCGGRGTGAARQALLADPDVKLWAVGDAFRDQTKSTLSQLRQ